MYDYIDIRLTWIKNEDGSYSDLGCRFTLRKALPWELIDSKDNRKYICRTSSDARAMAERIMRGIDSQECYYEGVSKEDKRGLKSKMYNYMVLNLDKCSNEDGGYRDLSWSKNNDGTYNDFGCRFTIRKVRTYWELIDGKDNRKFELQSLADAKVRAECIANGVY